MSSATCGGSSVPPTSSPPGLALTVIAIYVFTRGRNFIVQLVPLVFLLSMTVYALFIQLGEFYAEGSWLLLVVDAIIFILSVWLIVEAIVAFNRARGQRDRQERGTSPE